MSVEDAAKEIAETNQAGDIPYLGTWADRDAAEQGVSNMQGKMDSMGNEVGTLRNQVAMANQTIADLQSQQNANKIPEAVKGEAELAAIQEEMLKLDDEDPNYHQQLMGLMAQSNNVVADIQHSKTLKAAKSMFQEELNKRDTNAIHEAFYKDNPSFNMPEVQEQIQNKMSQDQTGMTDSLVAFREIERDNALEQMKALEAENADLKRLQTVNEGAKQTGKVVVGGNQTPTAASSPSKLTGAALDAEMQKALDALKK